MGWILRVWYAGSVTGSLVQTIVALSYMPLVLEAAASVAVVEALFNSIYNTIPIDLRCSTLIGYVSYGKKSLYHIRPYRRLATLYRTVNLFRIIHTT